MSYPHIFYIIPFINQIHFAKMATPTGYRLFKMYKEGRMTDIIFIVKGTEIKAHRNVASSHDGFLRDLLDNEDKRFVIDDTDPQTFKSVLE